MSEIHVADVGTIFRVTVTENDLPLDISTATVRKYIFRKPNGIVVEKDAIFETNGTDGKLKYVTVTGDLDVKGAWLLQAYLEMPTGKWHSDYYQFTVMANLE